VIAWKALDFAALLKFGYLRSMYSGNIDHNHPSYHWEIVPMVGYVIIRWLIIKEDTDVPLNTVITTLLLIELIRTVSTNVYPRSSVHDDDVVNKRCLGRPRIGMLDKPVKNDTDGAIKREGGGGNDR